jgi:hypothetical protein
MTLRPIRADSGRGSAIVGRLPDALLLPEIALRQPRATRMITSL